jgi:hypothetical protein
MFLTFVPPPCWTCDTNPCPPKLYHPNPCTQVDVWHKRHTVNVFMLEDAEHNAFYFLIQAKVFSNRTRGQIYTWTRCAGLFSRHV